ncbi:MAG: putative sugar O-methyltransferase, partial [Caldisericota bacterium]|nr:putative sugar O-methyltransferase [Caldisericota bacterium]
MPFLNGTDVDRIEQARNHVVAQITERIDRFPAFCPVFPWTLVNRAQSYIFDLPPESLRRIRLHADAMNGILGASEYLRIADGATFCKDTGYLFLGEGVPIDKWAREYDLPGMEDVKFGVQYKDLIVGSMTGQRQQNICNLYRMIGDEAERLIFVEIGAGYGSFALDMRRILPDCAYVIVDLPETLLYSAAYLSAHRPDLRAYIYAPGDDPGAVLAHPDSFDLAFIPNYRASMIDALPHIDIGFNSVSFPEMTEEAVRQYLTLIAPKLRRFFMSVNYRQPADVKHRGVDNLLAERFRLFP